MKLTFLNSTSPSTPIGDCVIVPFFIVAFVSNTSLILFAATVARGIKINTITSIINAIITCIAYEENTITSENNPILSGRAAF